MEIPRELFSTHFGGKATQQQHYFDLIKSCLLHFGVLLVPSGGRKVGKDTKRDGSVSDRGAWGPEGNQGEAK